MNSSVDSSATKTSTSSTVNCVMTDEIYNRNDGGAGRTPASSSAPLASAQVFKGEQKFMGTVKNHNVYNNSATGPQRPLQTFTGTQEFKKAVTNVNEAGSHSSAPEPQYKMQDMGDGIRVGVPLQNFDGDQIFHDTVTNNNSFSSNANNHNSNSGNFGCTIPRGTLSTGQQPTMSASAHSYALADTSTDTIPTLQSFTGAQQFFKDVRNNNTINSNNNNYMSGNVNSILHGSTSFTGNGVEVGGHTMAGRSTTVPERTADASWGKRVFNKNILQRFHGRQQFMGEVTNNNSINSNNGNVNSGNQWKVIDTA